MSSVRLVVAVLGIVVLESCRASGEAGSNPNVYGLPFDNCEATVSKEGLAALTAKLKATNACTTPPNEADASNARTMSLCIAAGDMRCRWSQILSRTPPFIHVLAEFVEKTCARPK